MGPEPIAAEGHPAGRCLCRGDQNLVPHHGLQPLTGALMLLRYPDDWGCGQGHGLVAMRPLVCRSLLLQIGLPLHKVIVLILMLMTHLLTNLDLLTLR